MLNCVQICKNTELHIHGKVANSSLKQCDCEIFFLLLFFKFCSQKQQLLLWFTENIYYFWGRGCSSSHFTEYVKQAVHHYTKNSMCLLKSCQVKEKHVLCSAYMFNSFTIQINLKKKKIAETAVCDFVSCSGWHEERLQ